MDLQRIFWILAYAALGTGLLVALGAAVWFTLWLVTGCDD